MVASSEGAGPGPGSTATTVIEALKHRSQALVLSSVKLTQLPAGLHDLIHCTRLDLSNNMLGSLAHAHTPAFPPRLVELSLTGCGLVELPSSIKTLSKLQRLFAGANRLADASVVFQCPALQHAGLSYNAIAELPAADTLGASGLMSLDLAHNALSSLKATLHGVAQIPGLVSVSLQGNPMCLLPQYQTDTRTVLPKLLYLDGQQLAAVGGSRPPTSQALTSAIAAAARRSANGAVGAADTWLELHFSDLVPSSDPFKECKERWQEQIDEAMEAKATVPPELDVPRVPLQPVFYHYQIVGLDGTEFCSVPLKLSPPTPPDVKVLFDPKAKAAADAAAAKAAAEEKKKAAAKPAAKGKPGAKGGKGAPAAEEGVVQEIVFKPGGLKLTLPINAQLAHRDMLRQGIRVELTRTTLTAVETTVAIPPPSPPAKGSKPAAGKAKKEEPPKIEFTVESKEELVGVATITVGSHLVDGYTFEADGEVVFHPPKGLFDGRDIRMALKDERHSVEPVASLLAKMRLHVEPLSGRLL